MRRHLPFGILLSAVWLTACAPAPAPDTRAADEAAIRKLDADWVKAAQTHSAAAWAEFYSADAVVLPPNEKIATNREAILKSLTGLLTLPGLNIRWEPTKVDVARSGDMAYLYGAYQLSFNDEKGNRVTDEGKILEIWKKQADGSWKCAVDTWNSDMPAAPPAK